MNILTHINIDIMKYASVKLNEITLDIMDQMKDKYEDKRQYKAILVGLKSVSTNLTEITCEEIEDFKK